MCRSLLDRTEGIIHEFPPDKKRRGRGKAQIDTKVKDKEKEVRRFASYKLRVKMGKRQSFGSAQDDIGLRVLNNVTLRLKD